jgi:hypothetical protein
MNLDLITLSTMTFFSHKFWSEYGITEFFCTWQQFKFLNCFYTKTFACAPLHFLLPNKGMLLIFLFRSSVLEQTVIEEQNNEIVFNL